jgi:hypothetical protein
LNFLQKEQSWRCGVIMCASGVCGHFVLGAEIMPVNDGDQLEY